MHSWIINLNPKRKRRRPGCITHTALYSFSAAAALIFITRVLTCSLTLRRRLLKSAGRLLSSGSLSVSHSSFFVAGEVEYELVVDVLRVVLNDRVRATRVVRVQLGRVILSVFL